MEIDVNYTHCGDHFAIHTNNTESLYCTYETNIMVYVTYTSIKNDTNKNNS